MDDHGEADAMAWELRRRESTGRPLGDETFVKSIGRLIGRALVPRKPGRKPARAKAETSKAKPPEK
jgi:hypothetical protein